MLDHVAPKLKLIKRKPARLRKGVPRDKQDFYPTPAYVTLALLEHEQFEGTIWDPCCGDGELIYALMTRLANSNTFRMSDLNDWGCNATIQDFLTVPTEKPLVENIITNLPFGLMDEMLPRGIALTTQKFATFARLGLLCGGKRRPFFHAHPPNRILVFSERCSTWSRNVQAKMHLEGKKETSSVTDTAWYVWDKASTDHMKIVLIEPGRKHVYRDVTRRIRSHLIQRAVERLVA